MLLVMVLLLAHAGGPRAAAGPRGVVDAAAGEAAVGVAPDAAPDGDKLNFAINIDSSTLP